MKKFLILTIGLLFFAAVFSFPALAQGAGLDNEPGWGFETFAALAAVIPIVTEILKGWIKPPPGFWTQFLSWVTGLVITFVVWIAGVGFLAGMSWWMMLIYGFGASLAANGIFDIGFIEKIIGFFKKE